jgi:hypothetical protein
MESKRLLAEIEIVSGPALPDDATLQPAASSPVLSDVRILPAMEEINLAA